MSTSSSPQRDSSIRPSSSSPTRLDYPVHPLQGSGTFFSLERAVRDQIYKYRLAPPPKFGRGRRPLQVKEARLRYAMQNRLLFTHRQVAKEIKDLIFGANVIQLKSLVLRQREARVLTGQHADVYRYPGCGEGEWETFIEITQLPLKFGSFVRDIELLVGLPKKILEDKEFKRGEETGRNKEREEAMIARLEAGLGWADDDIIGSGEVEVLREDDLRTFDWLRPVELLQNLQLTNLKRVEVKVDDELCTYYRKKAGQAANAVAWDADFRDWIAQKICKMAIPRVEYGVVAGVGDGARTRIESTIGESRS